MKESFSVPKVLILNILNDFLNIVRYLLNGYLNLIENFCVPIQYFSKVDFQPGICENIGNGGNIFNKVKNDVICIDSLNVW